MFQTDEGPYKLYNILVMQQCLLGCIKHSRFWVVTKDFLVLAKCFYSMSPDPCGTSNLPGRLCEPCKTSSYWNRYKLVHVLRWVKRIQISTRVTVDITIQRVMYARSKFLQNSWIEIRLAKFPAGRAFSCNNTQRNTWIACCTAKKNCVVMEINAIMFLVCLQVEN